MDFGARVRPGRYPKLPRGLELIAIGACEVSTQMGREMSGELDYGDVLADAPRMNSDERT